MQELYVSVKTPDVSYDYILGFINKYCFHLTEKYSLLKIQASEN